MKPTKGAPTMRRNATFREALAWTAGLGVIAALLLSGFGGLVAEVAAVGR